MKFAPQRVQRAVFGGVGLFSAMHHSAMMARKPTRRKRRMGKYIRGKIEVDGALGALATKALVAIPTAEVTRERMWLSSVKGSWALKDLTLSADDGPVLVGLAHGDYSAAEIEEFIENTGSWDEGDLVQQEVGKRKVRIVGTFRALGAVAESEQTFVLNEGRPITTKCGWILTTGKAIDFWAYNMGTGTLITGSFLHVYGHANLWPR